MVEHGLPAHAGYVLGVDLGTSNTVAVLRWPDGRTRPLLFDGAPIMPSGVYADPAGQLVVGRDAARLAMHDPAGFEPNPKQRVDEPVVLLGPNQIPPAALLAAVLAAVAMAAVEAVGFLPPAVLTFPASWGPQRRGVLLAAAGQAGWPQPVLVPEPVAAVRYFAEVLRRPIQVGGSLAVFDFGGGTLDIAVVRNDGHRDGRAQFVVLGCGGVPNLGGLDLDAALVEHLGAALEATRPGLTQVITRPANVTELRNRRLFWDDVRGAKEMLSRTAVAPVSVPGAEGAVHLTREELERRVQPLLARGVQETARVIHQCGLRPDQLVGLFLVGGSSRLPMVARMLHTELGIAPTVLEQPELPVAEGAMLELVPQVTGPAGQPAEAGPVSGAGGPGLAGPVSGPGGPGLAGPVSGPGLAGPVPGFAGPPQASAGQAPGFAGPPQAGAVPGSAGSSNGAARPWYRRRLTIAAVAATVAIGIAASVTWVLLNRPDKIEFLGALEPGPTMALPSAKSSPTLLTDIAGDLAYVASAHDDVLDIGSFDLAGGKVAQPIRTLGAKAHDFVWMKATSKGVVAFARTYGNDDGVLVVLDPQTLAERWTRPITSSNDRVVGFYDRGIVFVSAESHTLSTLRWDTGKSAWPADRENPKNSVGSEDTLTLPSYTKAELDQPSGFDWRSGSLLDPKASLLQVTSSKRLFTLDPATGKQRREPRAGVGTTSERYLGFDGKLYVAGSSSAFQIQVYDPNSDSAPRVLYTAPDGFTLDSDVGMVPCGGRLCLLQTASSKTQLVSISLEDGKSWSADVPGASTLVPIGDRVFVDGVGSSDAANGLYDPSGKQLLKRDEDRKSVAVRISSGSALLFVGGLHHYGTTAVLSGVDVATGQVSSLGTVAEMISAKCSWNRRFLVCPTDKTFGVWRFAK